MNGAEHYREAERLFVNVKETMTAIQQEVAANHLGPDEVATITAQANVMAALGQGHALLALAASEMPDRPVDPSTGGELKTIGRKS